MSTTWGSDRFDGTRAARMITMAAVAEDRARTDALWKPLDTCGRAEVLWSLAAHWRELFHQTAARLSARTRGQHFLTLLHTLGRDCCDPVREFALGALAALDIELSAPRCRPCARLAVEALCQAQLRFADAIGWPRHHLATIGRA